MHARNLLNTFCVPGTSFKHLCIHAGAVFMAGEQYGDEVRVIDIPGVSMELCGGTHVSRTGQIGAFKILSEGGIASGVRRVEAVAGPAAVDHMNTLDGVVRAIGQQLKAKNEELPARVTGMGFAYACWVIEIRQLLHVPASAMCVWDRSCLVTSAV